MNMYWRFVCFGIVIALIAVFLIFPENSRIFFAGMIGSFLLGLFLLFKMFFAKKSSGAKK